MKLTRSLGWSRIEGEGVEDAFGVLDERYAYPIPGAWFSPAYKRGRWDGKVHLIRRRKGGAIVFPSGLFSEIRSRLVKARFDIEVEDVRPDARSFRGSVEWTGPECRDYQREAVKKAVESEGGIVKLPIRAGKTIVASRITRRLGSGFDPLKSR